MAASMMMARRLLQLQRSSVTMSMGGLRMFASKEFEEATKRVQTAQKDPGNDVKLKLYALFKQATEGPVKGSAPSAFNFVAKAKWDAWNSLGKISSDEAEKQYIALVDKIAPAGSAKAAAPAAKAAPAPAAAGDKAGIVLTSVADGVMTVTMNRPEKKNALTVDSYNQIVQALDEAKTREDVNVVVLTGAGEYFSSGNDLGNFANIPPEGPQKMAADARVLLQRFVGAFIDFPKPLIAAVNGPAIGITVTTLALCDIVYCSDNATFHTPFMSLGQSPEGCSSLLFQEIMGPSRANEMLLMGRKFLATEAKGCGFVADVFPKSDFSASVSSRAKTIAGLPIKSLTYSKALTRMTKLQALHQINDAECKRLEERWLSEDCFKAITKFMSRKG